MSRIQPALQRFVMEDPPLIGTTPAGQRLYLGGFSGLRYLGRTADGKLRFLTHTDRGPNTEEIEQEDRTIRPFLLPNFQPRLVYLLVDPAKGTLQWEKELLLRRPDGKRLTGMPQKKGQEEPVDSTGKQLSLDPYGMDLEGIGIAGDGSFWLVEEYGPTVARFSADGKLLETLKPGNGLPLVLENRRLNRGFEGAALLGHRLYAVLQSPLDNPRSPKEKNSKNSRLVRIVEVDLLGRRTLGQFVYVLEAEGGDKIGDLAIEGPRRLLLVERDGKSGAGSFKRVFRVNLENATNLQLLPERISGPGGTLELMSAAQLEEAGIVPAAKEEVMDLAAAGVKEEKVEGVELVEGTTLAFIIDNDFGLDGTLDTATGRFGTKEEKPVLYLAPAGTWKR